MISTLGQKRDLSEYTRQTTDEEITKILVETSIPATAVLRTSSVSSETYGAAETQETGDSSTWLEGNLEVVWISAGGALFLAGFIWALLVYVIKRKKKKALRKMPESHLDPEEYYDSFKARVRRALLKHKEGEERKREEEEKAKKKMVEERIESHPDKSALQLAFSHQTTAPPMPSTVWKRSSANLSAELKVISALKRESDDLWMEDL